MEQFIEFMLNHSVLSLALVGIVGLLIAGELRRQISGIKQVGPAEVTHLLNHQDAVLLDVRDKSEYQEGSLPGAVSLPYSQIVEDRTKLEKYRQRPVVVFCKNGQQGARTCSILRKQGFENIYNLDGGLLAWRTANMPVQKTA